MNLIREEKKKEICQTNMHVIINKKLGQLINLPFHQRVEQETPS